MPASAEPILVTFVVQGAPDDPVNAAVESAGFFSFDSSLIPSGGGTVQNSVGIGASSLAFSWGGIDWDRSSADLYSATFDPAGGLMAWGIGGLVGGANAIQTLPFTRDDFWVSTFSRPFPFAYTFSTQPAGSDHLYSGRILGWSAEPSAPVPEPATLLLAGFGLTTVAARRMLKRG